MLDDALISSASLYSPYTAGRIVARDNLFVFVPVYREIVIYYGRPYVYAWKAVVFCFGSFFLFVKSHPRRSPNGTQPSFATRLEVSQI